MTVPYSGFAASWGTFVSSLAMTAGGQRQMRRMKANRMKEREEKRRCDCLRDGRRTMEGIMSIFKFGVKGFIFCADLDVSAYVASLLSSKRVRTVLRQ